MKNKIVIIILLVLAFLIVISAVGYTYNLSFIGKIVSEETRKKMDLKDAMRHFPDNINEYTLVTDNPGMIEVKNVCHNIEDNPILKNTGRTGEACMRTYVAEYVILTGTTTNLSSGTTTRDSVRINLTKFTLANDLLHLLVDESSKNKKIEEGSMFQVAPFATGWKPISSKFDLIVAQEGSAILGPTVKTYSFASTTDITKEPIQYFLQKYPAK